MSLFSSGEIAITITVMSLYEVIGEYRLLR